MGIVDHLPGDVEKRLLDYVVCHGLSDHVCAYDTMFQAVQRGKLLPSRVGGDLPE